MQRQTLLTIVIVDFVTATFWFVGYGFCATVLCLGRYAIHFFVYQQVLNIHIYRSLGLA